MLLQCFNEQIILLLQIIVKVVLRTQKRPWTLDNAIRVFLTKNKTMDNLTYFDIFILFNINIFFNMTQ